VQQQDAAINNPSGIRASVPEQGRLLTFKRAVAVDPWTDLNIGLKAGASQSTSMWKRLLILFGTSIVLGAFAWAGRSFRQERADASLK
jgi:hypothetical protein